MRLLIGPILKRKGVAQTKLADAIGLSPGYVSLLVSNKRQPSHDVLLKIADFLGVTLNDLMVDEAPQPHPVEDIDGEIMRHLDLLTDQEKQMLLAAAIGFAVQRQGEDG
ncbi:MAG: helix-turn-helix transcriptional regulator [Cereibacter changlensis]